MQKLESENPDFQNKLRKLVDTSSRTDWGYFEFGNPLAHGFFPDQEEIDKFPKRLDSIFDFLGVSARDSAFMFSAGYQIESPDSLSNADRRELETTDLTVRLSQLLVTLSVSIGPRYESDQNKNSLNICYDRNEPNWLRTFTPEERADPYHTHMMSHWGDYTRTRPGQMDDIFLGRMNLAEISMEDVIGDLSDWLTFVCEQRTTAAVIRHEELK